MKTKKLLVLFLLFFFTGINSYLYSQWVASGTTPGLLGTYPSISVVSPTVAWVSAGASIPQIFRTTNGGTTWDVIPTTGLPVKALMCIWALDNQTCFVGDGGDAAGSTGGDAAVSKTTNGGLNWTPVFNTGGSAGFFNGIVFSRINPQFGIAESDPPAGAGQPYYLQITTNGGATWTLANPNGISGAASAQNSVMVIDNLFFGFGLNAGASRVYLTNNGGTTGFIGTLGITGAFVASLAFHDNKQIGVAASSTSHPNIARSTDGGTTWTSVSLGGTGTTTNSAIKWINGTNTCYYLGQISTGSLIYKSTNSGLNWTAMTLPAGLNLFHFDFVRVGTTVTGYATSTTGQIIKLTDVVTSIEPETVLPQSYSLKQNYPNPFNPSTKISFDVAKSGFVSLKIYNLLGKEISTLVNENYNAGSHTVDFNASNLSSGVYFYTLEVNGYKETKQMLMIK